MKGSGRMLMKKKLLASFCALLLVPTMAVASTNMVSISELRQQVEAMGRWTQTYETPTGTLEVDIPILMPDVEECPVITVENDKPFNREMVKEMQNRATRDDVFTVFPYEMNGRNFEIVWGTNGWNGSTADYDEVTDFSIGTGIWRQTAHVKKSRFFSTPIAARYPWEMDLSESVIRNGNQTVEQVMNNWQELIDAMYPGRDYTIAPKWIRIYGYTQMDSDEADEGNGHYLITAEQVIGGLPVFGAIYSYGDFQLPYASTPETNKKQEKLRAYATGAFWKTRSILQIRSSSNDDYAANIGMNKVRSVELEDIPLASMEKVMQEIEKEISKGNIRNVYALRLGYMRYSNPDMKDYAWAIPMWVLDCKYITEENRETADSVEENTQDEVALIWDAYGFSQIPIDAQTGKMKIITTGDEEAFSVPKVITWEDVQ